MHPKFSSVYIFAARTASASLLCLIVLCVVWEMWLAPLRPGGSWLVLKTLPLLFPLRGILNKNPYTYQWTSLLVQGYFLEGLVRVSSDTGISRWCAMTETILAVILFVSVIVALRLFRKEQKRRGLDAITPAD